MSDIPVPARNISPSIGKKGNPYGRDTTITVVGTTGDSGEGNSPSMAMRSRQVILRFGAMLAGDKDWRTDNLI
jgi:hypothetical protein